MRSIRARHDAAAFFGVHLAEHGQRLVEVGVEVLLQQIQHLEEHGVAKSVIDLVAGFAADDHLFSAEHGKMLGKVRLLHLEVCPEARRR